MAKKIFVVALTEADKIISVIMEIDNNDNGHLAQEACHQLNSRSEHTGLKVYTCLERDEFYRRYKFPSTTKI